MNGHGARGRVAQSAAVGTIVGLALSLSLIITGCDEKLDAWPDARSASDVADATDIAAPLCSAERPVPVDVLWVVEIGLAMCQEQAELVAHFGRFVDAVESAGAVDLRVAVVTTGVLMEHAGRFWTTPRSDVFPGCEEKRSFPAHSNLHCECAACTGWEEAFVIQRQVDDGSTVSESAPYRRCIHDGGCDGDPTAARWRAQEPLSFETTYNANGSVNAACAFRCGDAAAPDQLCQDVFGAAWSCPWASYGGESAGCKQEPRVADCPEGLPGVLPGVAADGTPVTVRDHFHCIAAVGPDQSVSANLKSGMEAAWMALAPAGPLPDQICVPDVSASEQLEGETDEAQGAALRMERRETCERRFLRPDAHLVVVVLTDQDDCSVAEGKNISPEDYDRCQLLGDEDLPLYAMEYLPESSPGTDPLPLAPARIYVDRFRSLVSHPTRLTVAAISGDALGRDTRPAAAVDGERLAYFRSATDPANPLRLNTHMCEGTMGTADLGYRYGQLVDQLGDGGFFGNLCDPDGMGAVLEDLGQKVAARLPCGG